MANPYTKYTGRLGTGSASRGSIGGVSSRIPSSTSFSDFTPEKRESGISSPMDDLSINKREFTSSTPIAPTTPKKEAGLNQSKVNTSSTMIDSEPEEPYELPEQIDYNPSEVPTDIGGQSDLIQGISDQYTAFLSGEDPLAEQNENMAITALDRMQSNVDQSTARQAAELGLKPSDKGYAELLAKNSADISSKGSSLLSNLAAQNMERKDRIMSQGARFAEAQQSFGMDAFKTIENINRYGFEAAMADRGDKNKMAEYVMGNSDLFSVAQVGEAKKSYFGNLGIDVTTLNLDPNNAESAISEISNDIRVAHPDWTDAEIREESVRLYGLISPYSSGAVDKLAGEAGLSDDTDTETDISLSDDPLGTLTDFDKDLNREPIHDIPVKHPDLNLNIETGNPTAPYGEYERDPLGGFGGFGDFGL